MSKPASFLYPQKEPNHLVSFWQRVVNGKFSNGMEIEINDWCAENFGEPGIRWKFSDHYFFAWEFENETDYSLFILRWNS